MSINVLGSTNNDRDGDGDGDSDGDGMEVMMMAMMTRQKEMVGVAHFGDTMDSNMRPKV